MPPFSIVSMKHSIIWQSAPWHNSSTTKWNKPKFIPKQGGTWWGYFANHTAAEHRQKSGVGLSRKGQKLIEKKGRKMKQCKGNQGAGLLHHRQMVKESCKSDVCLSVYRAGWTLGVDYALHKYLWPIQMNGVASVAEPPSQLPVISMGTY